MATSLGSLLLTLGLDTSVYDRKLQNAKTQALSVGSDIEQKLKLKPTIDDSGLRNFKANYQQTLSYFQANPVKIRVDTSEFDKLDRLQNGNNAVKAQSQAVDTSALDNIGKDVEHGVSDGIKKALDPSSIGQVASGAGGAIASAVTAPLRIVGGIGKDIAQGLIFGVSQEVSSNLGKGISAGIEKQIAPLVGSFELMGSKLAGGLTGELVDSLSTDIEPVQKVLEGVLGKADIAAAAAAKKFQASQQNAEIQLQGSQQTQKEIAFIEANKDAVRERLSAAKNVRVELTEKEQKLNDRIASEADASGVANLRQQKTETRDKIEDLSSRMAASENPAEIKQYKKSIDRLRETEKNLDKAIDQITNTVKNRFRSFIDNLEDAKAKAYKEERTLSTLLSPYENESLIQAPNPEMKAIGKGSRTIKQLQRGDAAAQQNISDLYRQTYEQVAQASGVKADMSAIPQLKAADLPQGATGRYNPELNTLEVNQETLAAINSGKLTIKQLKTLVHELRHAFQSGFGTVIEDGQTAVQLIKPTFQEARKLGSQIEASAEGGGAGFSRDHVRNIEADAYVFAERNAPQIHQNLASQQSLAKLQNKVGLGGGKIDQKLAQAEKQALMQLIQVNKSVGVDFSQEISQAIAGIESLKAGLQTELQRLESVELLDPGAIDQLGKDLEVKFRETVAGIENIVTEAEYAAIAKQATTVPPPSLQADPATALPDLANIPDLDIQTTTISATEAIAKAKQLSQKVSEAYKQLSDVVNSGDLNKAFSILDQIEADAAMARNEINEMYASLDDTAARKSLSGYKGSIAKNQSQAKKKVDAMFGGELGDSTQPQSEGLYAFEGLQEQIAVLKAQLGAKVQAVQGTDPEVMSSQALASAEQKFLKFDKAESQINKRLESSEQEINNTLAGLDEGVESFGARLKRVFKAEGIESIGDAFNKLPNPIKQATGSARMALSVFGGFTALMVIIPILTAFADSSIKAALEFERLERVLDSTSGNGASKLAELDANANKLGVNARVSAQAYAQLSAATNDTSLEGAQTDTIFSGFSKGVASQGLGKERQELVFQAISQMAGKGVISLEELRQQLGESLPQAMGVFARAAGVSTGEFSKMVESGTVGSDFLVKAAQQMSAESTVAMASMADSTQASIGRMDNSIYEVQTRVGQGLLPLEKLKADAIAASINLVLVAIDPLFKLLGGAALSYIIKGFIGLAASAGTLSGGMSGLLAVVVKLAPAIMAVAAKFLLFYAAGEAISLVFKQFEDGGGKVRDFANSSISSLNDYKKVLAEARGEEKKLGSGLPKNAKDVRGEGLQGVVDTVQSVIPFATTGSEKRINDLKIATDELMASSNESLSQAYTQIGSGKGAAELAKLKDIDVQLADAGAKRRALALNDPANQDAKKQLQQQEELLLAQRETASKPVAALQGKIASDVETLKAALKEYDELAKSGAVDQGTYATKTTELKAALEAAEKAQNKLGLAVKDSVNDLTAFERAFQKIADSMEDASTSIDRASTRGRTAIANSQASGKITADEAGLANANNQRDALNQKVESGKVAISGMKSEIDARGGQKVFDTLGIDPNKIGQAELKTLTERVNAPKEKAILQKLGEVKTAEITQEGNESQLADSKLQVASARQQLATNQIGREAAKAESTTKRQELMSGAEIRGRQAAINLKRSKNLFFSDADAGVAEANVGISQSRSQQEFANQREASANANLEQIRSKRGEFTNSEEFEKAERDAIDQVAEARSRAAEADASLEEAKGRRIEAVNQKRIEQTETLTQVEESALRRRQSLADADMSMQRASLAMMKAKNQFASEADAGVAEANLGIKQAGNQKDFSAQAVANANRELQRNEQLYKAGAINAKKFQDDQRALTDKLTEARAKGTEAAAALEEAYAKKIEAVNRLKLEQLEQIRQKAEAAIALTQTMSSTALQSGLLNNADAGEVSQAQAGRSQTLIDQTAATARLALKRQELEQTRQLAVDGVLSRKDAADKEIAITQEIADAQAAQVQRQVQMQGQLRESHIKLLTDTAKLETEQIDRAKQLLESQGAIAKAQSELSISRSQTQLNLADRAFGLKDRLESQEDLDPRVKAVMAKQLNNSGVAGVNANSKSYEILAAQQKIGDQIAEKQKAAREVEFELAKKSFEFDQKKVEIADKLFVMESKRYKLDADRAKIQALKDFKTAKESGDTEGMQLAGMSLEVADNMSKVADEQLAAAHERLEIDKQLAENGRTLLNINQAKASEEAAGANFIRRQNNELALVEQFVKSETRGSIPGRATGGAVSAGKPYYVGEQGRELFIPKMPGEIVNAANTAAIGKPAAMSKLAAIDTSVKPAISGNGVANTAVRMPVYGTGIGSVGEYSAKANSKSGSSVSTSEILKNIEKLLTDQVALTGQIELSLKSVLGKGSPPSGMGTPSNPISEASNGVNNAISKTGEALSVGNSSTTKTSGMSAPMSFGGSGEISGGIDRLISVVATALQSPRSLTVSSPNPVSDAAKIYADISSQQVANEGL
ncbi:tape measure protein [Phormidium sp. FACHB-592]|uniref:Tape measure protein n=1 Tax=Stenomitos frigidus AS-A4 TaxID=2933935 RepID=A0ABV0KJU6_9CYAN|nr:tape measure protein [Phormidium sp. FACHB-592]MBD2072677.1 tape measure protein [Phormidium sp. FACHB-592]